MINDLKNMIMIMTMGLHRTYHAHRRRFLVRFSFKFMCLFGCFVW